MEKFSLSLNQSDQFQARIISLCRPTPRDTSPGHAQQACCCRVTTRHQAEPLPICGSMQEEAFQNFSLQDSTGVPGAGCRVGLFHAFHLLEFLQPPCEAHVLHLDSGRKSLLSYASTPFIQQFLPGSCALATLRTEWSREGMF